MNLCLLCLFVALSFIAPLLPIASASAGSDTMPCCAGKAGHCDSGIPARKRPQPKPEPMCGLKTAGLNDPITIVAEPVAETPSHKGENLSQNAAESPSVNKPCHTYCGACASTATRQQKRERSIVLSHTYQAASLTTLARYEDKSLQFSSTGNWPQINPRGPPARR